MAGLSGRSSGRTAAHMRDDRIPLPAIVCARAIGKTGPTASQPPHPVVDFSMPASIDNEDALAAVVCGMPFSGTTLMSRIICSHPLVNSGFECGLLLSASPHTFEGDAPRFFEWMTSGEPPHNWLLTADQLTRVCEAQTFYDAYSRLVDSCALFSEDVPYVLDKTPAYVYNLAKTMRKVPSTPFVVIRKDPIFQYLSYKKRDLDLAHFLDRLHRQNESLRDALAHADLRSRLLLVDFEHANQFKARTYRRVINFISATHPRIGFQADHVPWLNSNLKEEIASRKKKLRPRYDFDAETARAESEITPFEREQILRVATTSDMESVSSRP